jgi:hypothetical protein
VDEASVAPVCAACGVQSAEASPRCRVCEDDRVGAVWRQAWTTAPELRRSHRIVHRELAPGVTSLQCEPVISVGHHALLVRTAHGNVLWDCLPFIDDETVATLRELGGLFAIALSHPHFYGAMVDWSRALGGVPIYVHADDRRWVLRPDPAIVFFEGDSLRLDDDAVLVRCGGHFDGSAVLYSRRRLFTGDTISVLPDRAHVTFMHSFPGMIPLSAAAVRRIAAAVEPLDFDEIYGCWPHLRIRTDAKAAVARSVERYARWVSAS